MSNDDKVMSLIRQLIKEVKQEVRQKKVLMEAKEPEQIFENHKRKQREYITKIVLETLDKARD